MDKMMAEIEKKLEKRRKEVDKLFLEITPLRKKRELMENEIIELSRIKDTINGAKRTLEHMD